MEAILGESVVRVSFEGPLFGRRHPRSKQLSSDLITIPPNSTDRIELTPPKELRTVFDKYNVSLSVERDPESPDKIVLNHEFTNPPPLGLPILSFLNKPKLIKERIEDEPETRNGYGCHFLYDEGDDVGHITLQVVDPILETERQKPENLLIRQAAEHGALRGSRKDRTSGRNHVVKHHIGGVTVKRKDYTP